MVDVNVDHVDLVMRSGYVYTNSLFNEQINIEYNKHSRVYSLYLIHAFNTNNYNFNFSYILLFLLLF